MEKEEMERDLILGSIRDIRVELLMQVRKLDELEEDLMERWNGKDNKTT
jgi:hypothetical protein